MCVCAPTRAHGRTHVRMHVCARVVPCVCACKRVRACVLEGTVCERERESERERERGVYRVSETELERARVRACLFGRTLAHVCTQACELGVTHVFAGAHLCERVRVRVRVRVQVRVWVQVRVCVCRHTDLQQHHYRVGNP